MNPTARFYSQPSYVGGINIPVYAGSRRQAGGSVFGAIKRAVVPSLKTAGKEMGKQAFGLFTDVAGDVLKGKSLSEAVKERAKERAIKAAQVGIRSLGNTAADAFKNVVTRKRPATSDIPSESLPPVKRRRQRLPSAHPRRTSERSRPQMRRRVSRTVRRVAPAVRHVPIRRPLNKVPKQRRVQYNPRRLF